MRTLPFFKITLMSIVSLLCIWLIGCEADTDLYGELTQFQEDETITEEFGTTPNPDGATGSEEEFVVDENSYFVSSEASGSNDGKSEATAWTWQEAVSKARPGMTIYIKAGLYENYLQTLNTSGNSEEPIRFVGYKQVPGDIDATNQDLLGLETRGRRGTTVLADNRPLLPSEDVDSSEFPIFRKAYVINETAIILNGSNIELHNLGFSGYDTAIRTSELSENCVISNCIFHEQGNLSVGMRDNSNPDRYRGTGVDNRGSKNLSVTFCTFLNAEQNALQFLGVSGGKIENNLVYSYNTTNGTDYMFLISKNGPNDSVDLELAYNTAERMANVPHGGHAFVIKNGANNNKVRNFEVINSSIEVNFANVHHNTFENGNISGSYYQNKDALSGIFFGNGAHHNSFNNIVVTGSWGGITCSAYPDGASNDSSINTNHPGNDNIFSNIVIKDSQYAVIMSESNAQGSQPLTNNIILNCTFFNVEYGIRANRPNSGTKFYNTSFNLTRGLIIANNGYSLNDNTVFEHCHFNMSSIKNSVDEFNSNNNLYDNPMFTNPSALNNYNVQGLQLSTNSPLLNAGIDVSEISNKASKDFSGKTRTTYNIGVF